MVLERPRRWSSLACLLFAIACRGSESRATDTATPTSSPSAPVGSSASSGTTGGAADTSSPSNASAVDVRQAADVVRRYYDAIQRRDFDAAFALWGDGGKASGTTREAFAAGFANTTRVHATVADSGRIGAAAGSQYVTVPVSIDAEQRSGETQHFVGSYTLRRSMVDGATPEQRRWHIYGAEVRRR